MTKSYVILILICLSLSFLSAQELTYHTEILSPKARTAVVNMSQLGPDFNTSLFSIEAPSPDGDSYRAYLARAKRESARRFPVKDATRVQSRAGADQPILRQEFGGPTTPIGIPLDTHIAVSDSGQVVGVINFSIRVMDTLGNMLSQASLGNFFNSIGTEGTLFDPKVHYDPDEDRFILCALSRTDSSTNIYLGFSQTHNAAGSWNLYRLEGNPRDNNSWFDYPMLSIGTKEVFLTGNSIRNNEPWQTGFEETLIFQIDKYDGYRGDSLDMRIWSDIKFGVLTLRNLCPVKGGEGNFGPGHYFLSNRNFDILNPAFFIVRVSDSLNAPGVGLEVNLRASDVPYGLPPRGPQARVADSLDTNDARVLDAFIFNDKIQFVGNTIDTTNGHAGIYHGTIKDVSTSKFITGNIISEAPYTFGYPSLAFTGSSDPADGDFDAIIFFDMVAKGTFPATTALYYDGNGGYSDRIQVKEGTDFIGVLPNGNFNSERWGDYTGSQRAYYRPGKVWVIGTTGRLLAQAVPSIAEIDRPGGLVSIAPDQPKADVTVYPNPAQDFVTVEFDLPKADHLGVHLLDLQGRIVKTFYDFDPYQQGRMRFSFDTSPLASGIYLLQISTEAGILLNQKLVVK